MVSIKILFQTRSLGAKLGLTGLKEKQNPAGNIQNSTAPHLASKDPNGVI